MKRVHLACGDIYLEGYENVDRVGTQVVAIPIGASLEHYYDHKLHDNREPLRHALPSRHDGPIGPNSTLSHSGLSLF